MSVSIKKIWDGQTLARILMNEAFRGHALQGKVVDVGGARNPDYFDYFKKDNVSSITAVDGLIDKIDFEKDSLPFKDGSVNTAICANVLEHMYNHRFLIQEMYRVLKQGGKLVGFVPFFIQYHPDPHDYFRYTNEALVRLLADAGFKNVNAAPVGLGPFTVNFNNVMLSFPRLLRVLGVYPSLFLDFVFLKLRPNAKDRYPLGYMFTGTK